MKLTSPEFKNGKHMPDESGFLLGNISPALNIESIPGESKSLALIVDDPDALGGAFIHWILYDIPATTNVIKKNSAPGKQGVNSASTNGYYGPCPRQGQNTDISSKCMHWTQRLI